MIVKKFSDFVKESSDPKHTSQVTNNKSLPTYTGPTIDIVADKKTGQLLPNWNNLTDEQKKLFWDPGPIGRSIRLKAGMKYPDQLDEEQIDLMIELVSAFLDSFPSGYTQAASFVIDILHFLSYCYRWKKAITERDKIKYFTFAFLSYIFLYFPRAGNLIMTKMPNLVKNAIIRMEALKAHATRPFMAKVAYVIATVMVAQKIQELPDLERITDEVTKNRKNNILYGAILGDYDEQINQAISMIRESYQNIKKEIKKVVLDDPE